jgi:hypothetical protein
MVSKRSAITLSVVTLLAAVLLTGVPSVSAQAKDARIGTWKANTEKSKWSPGPPPKSLTVTVQPSGANGETATAEFLNADGTTAKTKYTANFDGKDYALTGSPIADKVSLKRIDARTTERTDKKDGKVVTTLKRVVSADGKTMTVTTTGTNAQGQPVSNVIVFDKQ